MTQNEMIANLNEASYWITEMISGDINDAENQHIKHMVEAIDKAIGLLDVDLFKHPDLLPKDVIDLLIEFGRTDECNYKDCDKLVADLNKLGYTCEYGLDASPYNLTKI